MGRDEIENRVSLVLKNGNVLRLRDMDGNGALRGDISSKVLCFGWGA